MKTSVAIRCGIVLVGIVSCMFVGAPSHGQERHLLTWTDLSGGYKIEASFVRVSGDTVELQDKQGKFIKVPLAKLSLESQLQAKKLANPKAFEKSAPSSSMAIPADIGPSPFPANPTIEQFMDTFIQESKAKSSTVFWHAMPKEMQAEVDALVVKGLEVAGPSILTQVRSLLGNIGKIVREKKQFILAHPLVAENQPIASALAASWPEIVAVTDVLTDKSIWAASNFQAGKIGPWFCAMQSKLVPPSEALSKKLEPFVPPGMLVAGTSSLEDMKYKVITKSADAAQIELMVAGVPPTKLEFKRVGESWLPVPFADQWKEQFAQARAAMDGMTEEAIKKTRLMVGTSLTAAGGIVGGLANAPTQEDFNQIIQQLVDLAQQSVGQAIGGGPPNGLQPPGNQPSSGQRSGRPGRSGLDQQ